MPSSGLAVVLPLAEEAGADVVELESRERKARQESDSPRRRQTA